MYRLFMVGAKLLGIYQIIEGLIQAAMLTTPRGAAYAPQLVPSCFLNLMIGTALAFGTGFIAKAVRIREEFDGEAPSISYRSALQVGIVLISLFLDAGTGGAGFQSASQVSQQCGSFGTCP